MSLPCPCCDSLSACYSPSVALAPQFLRTLDAAGRTDVTANGPFIFTNWMGSGVDVTFSATVAGSLTGSPTGLNSNPVGTTRPMNIHFSQPVYLRQLTVNDLDNNSEAVNLLSVLYDSITGGDGAGICASQNSLHPRTCVRSAVNNADTTINWNGPLVSDLSFTMAGPLLLGEFFVSLGFDVTAPVYIPVHSCRVGSTVTWYDESGTPVPGTQVIACPANVVYSNAVATPLPVTGLLMNGIAFGDDSTGLGENLCNIVPAPTSMVGFSPVGAGAGCLNPQNGANTLTWAGPLSSVAMEYSANGQVGTGAALMQFSSPAIGAVSWVAHGVLALGESWVSLPLTGGGYAVLTATTAHLPGQGVSFDGGVNVRVNGNLTVLPNYGFKLEFFQ